MKAIYKATDIVGLGLHSLLVHLGRSSLTALGIVFAVWSVIAMLAINEGFSLEAQESLRELGSDNIIIESVKPPEGAGKATQSGGALVYGVKHADVRRLLLVHKGELVGKPVAGLMIRNPKRIRLGELASKAVAILNQYRIDELPVVDAHDRPVGLIDVQDIVTIKVVG